MKLKILYKKYINFLPMSDSSDSWEVASQEEIKYTLTEIKKRKTIQRSRLNLLHKVLVIIDCLQKPRKYLIPKGMNQYEIIAQINKISQSNLDESDNYETFKGYFNGNGHIDLFNVEITKFLSLNFSGIPARLYFVINDDITTFIEYKLNDIFIKETKLFKGHCFSIDFDGFISDQTLSFSTVYTHHSFFIKLLQSINMNLKNTLKSDNFKMLDDQRLKVIPSNLNKLKLHPLYITEECCNNKTAIYPKRPIFGYFKGSPVYSRKNVIKLKTQKSWYMNGRILKQASSTNNADGNDIKPYRIDKQVKLFAEFQTEPIDIQDLTGNEMDAFHPNFTPKKCVYLNCDSIIPKELEIPYAECIVGFRYKDKIKKGVFIKKEHCFAVNYFAKEHEYYDHVFNEVKEYEALHLAWWKFLKKLKKFIEIKNRIG